jgi:hypothetical protein
LIKIFKLAAELLRFHQNIVRPTAADTYAVTAARQANAKI